MKQPRRIDWLDDPNAPEINSLVPSASTVVIDEGGRILLIHRTDNDLWSVPGGAMEFGESIKQTAVRETLEETGIEIEIVGLVGIYTNPARRIEYTSNGEVRQEFSVVFLGRPIGGEPATSAESSEVHWIKPDELDQFPMNADVRKRIDQALSDDPEPYLG